MDTSGARVGIVMGSDSDLAVMKAAEDILKEFDVASEITVVSAHRTPERMFEYARSASGRGIQVLIAGAGGSAHLPGMIAALTPLPVIGVPVKSSQLAGLDSLLSVVQMPPGVPVATVAINGAKNAGLLALQILGAHDESIREKIADYKKKIENEVLEKVKQLEEKGAAKYLQDNNLA